MWGCANKKLLGKVEVLQKRCIRNVALKSYRAHTEPILKKLEISTYSDKLAFCWSVFTQQFRDNKLSFSFSVIFTDITNNDELQTRHTGYNYPN